MIVGAGVAGLACAGELRRAGSRAVVLERSRGVGGRCATRRVDGTPVDHGVAFLHGVDGRFLDAMREALGSGGIEGWPRRVAGEGPPCQPAAFVPSARRLAAGEGISAFPKALAEGIDVRRETQVVSIGASAGGVRVEIEGGAAVLAKDAVLALPAGQARGFLAPLAPQSRDVASACGILEGVASLPCLTLIAGYPSERPDPGWDILYPEESRVLQLVSHDSSKRTAARFRVLVFQARPLWSKARLDADPSSWGPELLAEAGAIVGPWASRPAWTEAKHWRHARAAAGDELAGPLLLRVPGGGRIGVAGEIFAPSGGVEGAWLSGRALARRLVQEH